MQNIDANTLYYAFSTIAQAGAGAFAFVSAFVLYRLQTADQRMSSSALYLAQQTRRLDSLTAAQGYIVGRQYKLLLESFGVSSQVIKSNPSLLASSTLLESEIKIAQQLIAGFKQLIWPTVILLSVSVLSICIVNTLVESQCAAIALAAVTSTGFIALLVLQARLLTRCLHE